MSGTSSLESIFFGALEKRTPAERAAFLDEACAGDADIRRRVDRMITAQAARFLEFSAVADGLTIEHAEPIGESPGTIIGPYKLLQQIGEGGMGVVFMAEQNHPLQRTVALKIIKPGMDSRQVIARFEAERQALAMMDHPNIAKVLDAGTTDTGRPYFVMELVKGIPITKYCDEKHLSLRQRLDLFVEVCHAVQHAHQKGIIHRDIKPTNVLVAEYDNHAVPKIIDFGVAKATAQKLTERTMFTEFGQVIGTVEYMSPEQAKFNQLDIDTRSDIYSLGVLLYELLTGSTPFEQKRLREAGFDEVLRIIREEDPPKPSTRLSTSETLASIAANRHIEPARLSKEVRGDLDWIVMRSLEKDRGRRYETANALAMDVQRYLNDESVLACPPSTGYRLRKLVRKHKAALVTATFIAAALLLGVIASTLQAIRATRAESLATQRLDAETQARQEAEAVTNFLVSAFESPNPSRDGRKVTVAEIFDRAEKQVDEQLSDQPLTQATLLSAIGRSRRGLGLYSDAISPLRKAIDLAEKSPGRSFEEKLKLRIDLAHNYIDLLRTNSAIQILEPIVEEARRDLGDDHPTTLRAISLLGTACRFAKRYDFAINLLKEAVAGQRRKLGDENLATLSSITQLGIAYSESGRQNAAIPLLEESFSVGSRKFGADHTHTLNTMNSLAVAYGDAGRYDESIQLHEKRLAATRKKLGDDHPSTQMTGWNTAIAIRGRANAYRREGKPDEAERYIDTAVAKYLAMGNYMTAFRAVCASENIERLDRFIHAASALEQQTPMGPADTRILGVLRILDGKPDQAARTIRAGIESGDTPHMAYMILGWSLYAQKNREDASNAFRKGLRLCRTDAGTYDFKEASEFELTSGYFLDLIPQQEYVNRLKDDSFLSCVPWFYVGQRCEMDGDQAAAIAAYRTCLNVDETHESERAKASFFYLARWRLQKLGEKTE